jgi:hypothetical protein
LTSGTVWTFGREASTMSGRITDAERRLYEFLDAQTPQAVYLLTALMYLGRGDFEAKELRERYEEVSETFGGPKGAISLLLGIISLPEFLDKGLKKAESAGVDLDS